LIEALNENRWQVFVGADRFTDTVGETGATLPKFSLMTPSPFYDTGWWFALSGAVRNCLMWEITRRDPAEMMLMLLTLFVFWRIVGRGENPSVRGAQDKECVLKLSWPSTAECRMMKL